MARKARSNERILVVDDELGLRKGYRRALTRSGFQVDVAAQNCQLAFSMGLYPSCQIAPSDPTTRLNQLD